MMWVVEGYGQRLLFKTYDLADAAARRRVPAYKAPSSQAS